MNIRGSGFTSPAATGNPDMTITELMIDAIIGGVWHLERWDDVSDRLMVARIALNYAAPTHEALHDLRFLAGFVAERSQ